MSIVTAWAGVVIRNAAMRASDTTTANCSTAKTPPLKRLGVETKNERFMSMLLRQGGVEPVGDRGVG
jgi:hypothetical protein